MFQVSQCQPSLNDTDTFVKNLFSVSFYRDLFPMIQVSQCHPILNGTHSFIKNLFPLIHYGAFT
jgi:hypothetical protein